MKKLFLILICTLLVGTVNSGQVKAVNDTESTKNISAQETLNNNQTFDLDILKVGDNSPKTFTESISL